MPALEMTPTQRALTRLVGDLYSLMAATQGAHWNITGPAFRGLHKLFGEFYEAMAEQIDEVAERLRALGALAPHGLSALHHAAQWRADPATHGREALVAEIIAGHEAVVTAAEEVLARAEEAGDAPTADLATELIGSLQKNLWMLRASQE